MFSGKSMLFILLFLQLSLQACNKKSSVVKKKQAEKLTESEAQASARNHSGEHEHIISTSDTKAPTLWFHPNQHGNAQWYKPQPGMAPLNGGLDESFGKFELWPNLADNMKVINAGFGIFAAQIGATSSKFFKDLQAKKIPISVEMPGFSQCIDGWDAGLAELFGDSVKTFDGRSFFDIYATNSSPAGKGWLFTKDGDVLIPYEIVLDHHSLGLLKDKYCLVNGENVENMDYNKKLDLLLNDYVEYSRRLREFAQFHKIPPPKLSIHWAVNPGWEWIDEPCLNSQTQSKEQLNNLANPCYNSVRYLEQLILKLCNDGKCPNTIYFDVDWLHKTSYSVDTLQRHLALIKKLKSQSVIDNSLMYGINLVDPCDARLNHATRDNFNCYIAADKIYTNELRRQYDESVSSNSEPIKLNRLHSKSYQTLLDYITKKELFNSVDPDQVVRVQSWSGRPIEKGNATDEKREASFANMALKSIKKLYPTAKDPIEDSISLVDFTSKESKSTDRIQWRWLQNKVMDNKNVVTAPTSDSYWKTINYQNKESWATYPIYWWNILPASEESPTFTDVDLLLNNLDGSKVDLSSFTSIEVDMLVSAQNLPISSIELFIRNNGNWKSLGRHSSKEKKAKYPYLLNRLQSYEKNLIDSLKFRVHTSFGNGSIDSRFHRVHLHQIQAIK